jgi:hypothetical protein
MCMPYTHCGGAVLGVLLLCSAAEPFVHHVALNCRGAQADKAWSAEQRWLAQVGPASWLAHKGHLNYVCVT